MPRPAVTPIAIHAGFFYTGIVTTMLGPLLPELTTRFSLSDSGAGSLFVAQFLAAVLATLFCSALLERFGYRPVLVLGFLLQSSGVWFLALREWLAVVTGVAIYGVGLGLVIPAMNLLTSRLYPERRASALNLLNASWGSGAVAGPLILAWLIERGGMDFTSASLLAMGIVSLTLMSALPNAVTVSIPREKKSLVNRPALLIGLMLFLYVGTENTIAGWLPTYASRLGATPGQAALTQTILWGFILAGRLATPAVLLRVPVTTMVWISLSVAPVAVGALALVPALGMLSAAAAFAGLSIASLFPNIVACYSARDLIAAQQGASVVFAMSGLGGAILPWCAAQLVGWTGNMRFAIGLAFASTIVMAAAWTRAQVPVRAAGDCARSLR